jgi:hypothetical protein
MQRWRRGLCRNKGSPRRVGPRLARGTARDRGRVALRCDFWVLSEVGDDHWSHSSAAGERERDAGFLGRSLGRPTGLQFVTTASGCWVTSGARPTEKKEKEKEEENVLPF